MRWIHYLYGGYLLLGMYACNNQDRQPSQQLPEVRMDTTASPQITDRRAIVPDGNYASAGYDQRAEGYDWVGVQVTTRDKDLIQVSIRSRADKKKPTCTMDAEAKAMGNGVYKATLSNGTALFTFGEKGLQIPPETDKDEGALHFYCSGGATIQGTYTRISGALDSTQIDKTKAK